MYQIGNDLLTLDELAVRLRNLSKASVSLSLSDEDIKTTARLQTLLNIDRGDVDEIAERVVMLQNMSLLSSLRAVKHKKTSSNKDVSVAINLVCDTLKAVSNQLPVSASTSTRDVAAAINALADSCKTEGLASAQAQKTEFNDKDICIVSSVGESTWNLVVLHISVNRQSKKKKFGISYTSKDVLVAYGVWHLHVRLAVLRDLGLYHRLVQHLKSGLLLSEEKRQEHCLNGEKEFFGNDDDRKVSTATTPVRSASTPSLNPSITLAEVTAPNSPHSEGILTC